MKRHFFMICVLLIIGVPRISAAGVTAAETVGAPSAGISLNKTVLAPGDRLIVTLTTAPGSGDGLWDAYAVLFLPDDSYYFLSIGPPAGFSSGPVALFPTAPVKTGSMTLLDMTLPAGLPEGTWSWAAAFVRPGFGEVSEISRALFEINNKSDTSWESPFGFHPASVAKPGYDNNGYHHAQDIGVRWTRDGVYAFWFLVQPDLSKQEYDFSRYDNQWSRVPAGIHILGNIAPQGNIEEGYCLPRSYLPVDEQKYAAFVRAVVERYDGDGIDDMQGLVNPIKYWQVGNEPSSQKPGFADLQRITYTAIKEACSDCMVLIGGVPGMPPVDQYISNFDNRYKPILDALGGKYVDIMDFHWYGNATGDYKGAKDVYDHIRSVMDASGFPPIPFWIAEMGSYSGDPAPAPISNPPFDYTMQTERQQALDYVKRFVYPLSFGVKKLFPAFGLMEGFKYDGGYFDFTGLIYDGWGAHDPGLGVKKLGYYSYKKMTEMLEGSDWNNITTITDADDIHVYAFSKGGKKLWVAWDDANIACITTPCGRQVTIAGLDASIVRVTDAVPMSSTGKEVTDYAAAFYGSMVPVSGGSVVLTLGDSPVYIEELQ